MPRQTIVTTLAVFTVALLLRLANFAFAGEISPVDELYHLKRMELTAAHFPAVLQFDVDRGIGGAFCPWPPLYDGAAGGAARLLGGSVVSRVIWFPPLLFALFVAIAFVWMLRRFGRTTALAAGAALAASPFTVTMSWIGSIDHHWLEPMFVVAIVAAICAVIPSAARQARRPGGHEAAGSQEDRSEGDATGTALQIAGLAVALTAAMFVQTALLVAAALAFVALFVFSDGRAGAIAFASGAVAIAVYRAMQPAGYPDNAWFLGWTHAALFGAAATALAYRAWGGRPLFALLAGAGVVLATPSAPASLLAGSTFFGGERWLHTIVEFQPFWRARGGDLASILIGLGAGAILCWPLAVQAWRRRDAVRGTVALFAIAYLLLTISSRRFWSVGIPMLAIAGALYAASLGRARWLALVAVAVVPPVQFALWMTQPQQPPVHGEAVAWMRAARFLQTQPRGRVLAPWSWGHLLDVAGRRAVIVDNFGTMAGAITFDRAYDAFLTTHEETLARYCRESGVRFVAYENPSGLGSAATVLGLDAGRYAATKLERRTVWWRAWSGAALPHFARIYARDGIVICRYTP